MIEECAIFKSVWDLRRRWFWFLPWTLALLSGCAAVSDALQPRYRLVIDYAGILCGGTIAEEQAIDAAISGYEARLRTTIKSRKTYWGLEGERSRCYSLNNLSRANQTDLIAVLRDNSVLTCASISENAICQGSPRRSDD
jgi:hypothetical protein